jgi:hypothetical protein
MACRTRCNALARALLSPGAQLKSHMAALRITAFEHRPDADSNRIQHLKPTLLLRATRRCRHIFDYTHTLYWFQVAQTAGSLLLT